MMKRQEKSRDTMKEVSFENIVANAIKIPGVKVSRNEFLAKIFENEDVDLHQLIEEGPIVAGCSQERITCIADKLILKRTSESSVASFAAGIPGGMAMAATIPADTLQFFGMTLRLAQELTYLYGANDLWQDGEVNSIMVRDQLILYCGVMFGVAGTSAGVRLLSAQLAKQTLKKLPQKALTKTFWYPMVKQICKVIGIKITKDTAAKGISKAIPVIGGIVSGGITFASMKPMGKRLADTLDEANFNYSDEKAMADYIVIEQMSANEEKNERLCEDGNANDEKNDTKENSDNVANDLEDVFEKIEKLAKLRDIGAISKDDFDEKKNELLSRI